MFIEIRNCCLAGPTGTIFLGMQALNLSLSYGPQQSEGKSEFASLSAETLVLQLRTVTVKCSFHKLYCHLSAHRNLSPQRTSTLPLTTHNHQPECLDLTLSPSVILT